MKKILRGLAATLLAGAVLAGSLRPALARETAPLDCAAAVLMEAESGQILYAYNADGRRAPASLTKLMTLLLVFEEMESGALAPEDEVTASLHASAMGGSQIWLEPYETMTVDELLRATAIASANDAAVALAEACAGTEGRFVAEMNERAARLGLTGTRYENASGLDEDGARFVLGRDETREFMDRLTALLDFVMPLYAEEGRYTLHIAIGCTGGRHRSVAVADALARRLSEKSGNVTAAFRDIEKG